MEQAVTTYGAAQDFAAKALNSNTDECVLWPYCRMANGYGRIRFGGPMFNVHRLICIWAHGEPPTEAHEAAHSCGVRLCVNPRHLRWATTAENHADKIVHGTHPAGERNRRSKLQPCDVVEIFGSAASGNELATQYGVSPATISSIRHRRKWKHLTG